MISNGKADWEPRETGFDPVVPDRLDSHCRQLIEQKNIDADTYLPARGGKIFTHRAIGKRLDSPVAAEFVPDSIRPRAWSLH